MKKRKLIEPDISNKQQKISPPDDQPSLLDHLPDDMIKCITNRLDNKSVLSLTGASKRFFALLREGQIRKQINECGAFFWKEFETMTAPNSANCHLQVKSDLLENVSCELYHLTNPKASLKTIFIQLRHTYDSSKPCSYPMWSTKDEHFIKKTITTPLPTTNYGEFKKWLTGFEKQYKESCLSENALLQLSYDKPNVPTRVLDLKGSDMRIAISYNTETMKIEEDAFFWTSTHYSRNKKPKGYEKRRYGGNRTIQDSCIHEKYTLSDRRFTDPTTVLCILSIFRRILIEDERTRIKDKERYAKEKEEYKKAQEIAQGQAEQSEDDRRISRYTGDDSEEEDSEEEKNQHSLLQHTWA